ncbi:zinc metalloprotease HtpX [uncultured Legionella sp.]|uniref:zinc metalloprotease HtpX n=1 Tax=uncultured Legionella sp. TaxID=210934 RepID=UPI00261F393F|nr:zinc metalloprotease HtpX [uncultured Legionella sp.]
MNNIKTFIFLAALTALLLVIGRLIAGQTGMMIALLLAVFMNFSAYWNSDKIVLKMYQAQPLPDSHPVYNIVRSLASKANTPMPKVYRVETNVPNAFATGRNPEHAVIAVTSGLLTRMNEQELTGVLAHELCHVLHRDTFISVVAATLAGGISGVANIFMLARDGNNRTNPIAGFLVIMLAPIAAGLIQMAVSRSREFEADKGGAELTGKPLWLADALLKLEHANHRGNFQQAENHPTTAHLFIVNPLSGDKFRQLFVTHPPTAERVERLRAMAGGH